MCIRDRICSVDMDSRSGSPGAERKVKGTLHWLSAQDARPCEMRLYEPILLEDVPEEAAVEEEGEETEAAASDFMARVNPDSLTVVQGLCEPCVAEAENGKVFQFLRTGYFCKDPDSTAEKPVYNRTGSLKDSWAKAKDK